MNLSIIMLAVVMATGAFGSAWAGDASAPEWPAPAHPVSRFTSAVSAAYSFAEIADLPDGTEHREPTGAAFLRAADTAAADLSDVANSAPMPLAGANRGGSLLGAVLGLNGTMVGLAADMGPGDLPATLRGASSSRAGATFAFPIAEMPDPAGWMTLLCGVAVVAFMARRKSRPDPD
jgi:hypothetical protein